MSKRIFLLIERMFCKYSRSSSCVDNLKVAVDDEGEETGASIDALCSRAASRAAIDSESCLFLMIHWRLL